MTPQDIPYKTDFILEAPLAALFKGELMRNQQRQADLDAMEKQLANEKAMQMNPLDIEAKKYSNAVAALKAAQSGIEMSPENLARFNDEIGFKFGENKRKDELANISYPMEKRLEELKAQYARGELPSTQPANTIGFPVANKSPSSMADVVRTLESNGKDFDASGKPLTSKKGALFGMQVMPSTATQPGFGITPAQSQTPEEYNRVGTEYIAKMEDRYGGDKAKALAAYNAGAGTVDNAVAKAERSARLAAKDPNVQAIPWLDFMPAETRLYVENGLGLINSSTSDLPEKVTAPVQQLQPSGQVAIGGGDLASNPEVQRIMQALMLNQNYQEKLGLAQAKRAGSGDMKPSTMLGVARLAAQMGVPPENVLKLLKEGLVDFNKIETTGTAAMGDSSDKSLLARTYRLVGNNATVSERAWNTVQNFDQAATKLNNLTHFSSDVDGGLGTFAGLSGKTGDTLVTALSSALGRTLSTEEQRGMEQMVSGLENAMAMTLGGGFASSATKAKMDMYKKQVAQSGDNPYNMALFLAEMKQELRNVDRNIETKPGITPDQAKAMHLYYQELEKNIPWTVDDVQAAGRKGKATVNESVNPNKPSGPPPGFKPL